MIKVLDSNISDKIAAGEVIERPVSIVKELVENSIDAGAGSIIVEIRNGGKSYIRVTDDGCGIPSDEVATAFLRHATSKISGITDLDNIISLGFRGEALASIAAVTRLTVVTRTEEDVSGTKLVLHGGKEISSETVGSNVGTTMVVEDVFYNTPARRKFMGSDAREASVIIELVEHYSICYDNIRFMLINNDNTVFTTAGDGDKINAINTVYPTKEYMNLLPVDTDVVKGYISNPGVTKSNRKGQLFFVNGRYVSSQTIEKGIEKGYGERIFSGYPIAILFIEVDPSTIDVNIHPGKKEINFLNKDVIINEVASAIKSAMDFRESVPHAESIRTRSLIEEATAHPEEIPYETGIETEVFPTEISIETEKIQRPEPLDIKDYLNSLEQELYTVQEEDALVYGATKATEYRPFEFDDLKFKGYIFNAYIIMQAEDCIYLLDQHAAHERIFYEKLTTNYLNSHHAVQPILAPILLNVDASVYSADREWMNTLNTIGYDIEDFGPDMFVIKGIPEFMNAGEAESFARSFIDDIYEYSNNSTVIDKLIMKSCKSAVKANERLSDIEIEALLDNLSQCENPFSCPHGRPTFIKVTRYDIEKSFKRK